MTRALALLLLAAFVLYGAYALLPCASELLR